MFHAEGIICAQIKISGYADKFWGHFGIFSGLLSNKNKIRRYEYAKEQSGTKKGKKNFAPVFCVFAYLTIPQRNHSLRPPDPDTVGKLRFSAFTMWY